MVKTPIFLFFGGLMTVYFLVRWMLIFGETGVLRWYLTDLLFVPAMCTFGLIAVRLTKRDWTIHLAWWHVFVQVVLVSIYFEVYLPTNHAQYTADPWDIVMYFLGGGIFLILQKRL